MEIDDAFLTAAQTRRRYGNASDMKIWRWLHDAKLGFPQPILINGRRHWRLSDLQKFDAACVTRQTKTPLGRNSLARQSKKAEAM
jgi:hypothetical protein